MVIFDNRGLVLMKDTREHDKDLIYTESISSGRTEALFLALTVLFVCLLVWRVNAYDWEILGIVFAVFSGMFLFYALNYRRLTIQITPHALRLTFGIFSWTVPRENMQSCQLDELPLFMKYGGAGIHFMSIRKLYRASFNFLEYPRVLIAFKEKIGPVAGISFSTRQPESIMALLEQTIAAEKTT
jgi:xanthine/uracil permease